MSKAQTTVEYVIIIGIVTVALFYMGTFIRRGTQSIVKSTADQLAVQKNAEQDFAVDTSHLEQSNTHSKMDVHREVRERIYTSNAATDERSEVSTNTFTNMGFTP